jgi:hypothetical protein
VGAHALGTMNKPDQTQKSPADRKHDEQIEAEQEHLRKPEQKPGPHPSREQTGIVGPEGAGSVADPARRTDRPARE